MAWEGCELHRHLLWSYMAICALGTSFSYDRKRCEQESFSNKVNQTKKFFNLYSQRDLSLYGKITIARSLGLSKLIFFFFVANHKA